ncbi:MAG: hypothetical protein AAF850_03925 [Pseudomonadota bacterium]
MARGINLITENLPHVLGVTCAALGLTLVSHFAAGVENLLTVAIGLSLLGIFVVAGFVLTWITGEKLPPLFWVSMVALAAGFPGVPGSAWVIDKIQAISFIATITPVLAFAALGIRADDVSSFRQNGLKIAVVAIFVFLGTFIGSALIAQLAIMVSGV